jgi:hypothetical protein
MNQSDIVNAATQAARQSQNILARQADRQAASAGAALTRTAGDLKGVGANLRESGGIGAAADVMDWAADYVARAGRYLSDGNSERFIVDAEAFARERPWTVAASLAALGFAAARVVKASSARRFAGTGYGLAPDDAESTTTVPAPGHGESTSFSAAS